MMKHFARAGIAATFCLSILATPAVAGASGPRGISPHSNAGYVMSDDVHSVAATWTVPNVRCGQQRSSVRFAVELADPGTELATTLGVDVDCQGGVAAYDAWLHWKGSPRSRMGDVDAGDVMQASLGARDDGYSGFISDVTIGWVLTFDGAAVLHPTELGVVVARRFGRDGPLPLADFGAVAFTGMRVDGRAVTPPLHRLDMRPRDGSGPLVAVSKLDRHSGSFTATRLS